MALVRGGWAGGAADDSCGGGREARPRCGGGAGGFGAGCDRVGRNGDCGGVAVCARGGGGAPGGETATSAGLPTGVRGDDSDYGCDAGGAGAAATGVAVGCCVLCAGGGYAASRPYGLPGFEVP